MLLQIKSLFDIDGYEQDVSGRLDLCSLSPDVRSLLSDEVTVTGSAANRAGVVTLNARLSVPIAAPCDRCLVPVKRVLDIDVNHTLVKELSGEDAMSDEYIEVGADSFDLNELFLSELILNLPTKILCSPGCKGLCPECGADLNAGDCSCHKDSIDPRLAALRELIQNSDSE